MLAQTAKLLTESQVRAIHEAALGILAEVGLRVNNSVAREVFARHGCRVDPETQIVRFPPALVEDWRKRFPPKFTFHGRDPRFDRTIPEDAPLIATASACPDVIDLETGAFRRATSADIARMAHLVNELPGYDVFSVSTLADDAPEGMFSLSRYYPALKNCLKPVVTGVQTAEEAGQVVRLAAIIAGSEAAFRDRPFIMAVHSATISPLTMDLDSTAMCMYYAEQRLPALAAVVPNGGLTAPLTLAGILALGNAEFLAVSLLPQMVREGTPVVYYTLPTVGDMRSGAYAPGGIECGLLHMAFAQMAEFYGVPSGGYIGLTNSKVVDVQAGFEKGMSPLAGMLAGEHLLVMGGLIDSLLAFSFPQAVIDAEIGEMIKRARQGIAFGADDLALDVIRETGPGGIYIDKEHTRRHMLTAAYLPAVADRQSRTQWLEAGGLDAGAAAMNRVREVLAAANPAVFSPEVDAEIHRAFPGLVPGDSRPISYMHEA